MQETFDKIYEKSVNNALGSIDLYKVILSKENILLAYRNVKTNKGSKTYGVDKTNIDDLKALSVDELIETVRNKVENYKPNTIRRVYIPKSYGEGKRPLGIPCMWDRLIQQMIKQVLEPVVESKFHKHSYGFRPNRSCEHAMARCQALINRNKLYYVVDIDIKSFFDEVNHHKLIQQMYTMGIKDSRILTIINAMLKAPIEKEGISRKGTPQGGILSPLLSGVVLNELDWWISNQWETYKTKSKYNGTLYKYRCLKETKLKEMFIVRYADDVKVFTRTLNEARLIKWALADFLNKRLHLEISEEKSTITNLKKHKSSFLGFEIKAVKKKNKYVARTYVSKKRKERIENTLKKSVKDIQRNPTIAKVENYNATVMGLQNYFQKATCVNIDFSEIYYSLLKVLKVRLRYLAKYRKPERPSELYKERYKNNYKTFNIFDIDMFPVADIRTRNSICFSQDICNYTIEGREKLHSNINYMIQNVIDEMIMDEQANACSIEYYDNQISRYSMQRGKCAITGVFLNKNEIYCRHNVQPHLGGDDSFKNLVIVHDDVKELLDESCDETTAVRIVEQLKLKPKQIEKLNKLRERCNLSYINR